jgi:PAS domain S-box-containing protein
MNGLLLRSIFISLSGYLFFVICFLLVNTAVAQPVQESNLFNENRENRQSVSITKHQVYPLDGAALYWEDVNNQLDIDHVRAHPNDWQLVEGDSINFGYSGSSYWIHSKIDNYLDEPLVVMGEYALIDYVDVWIYRNNQLLQVYETGDARDFATRPLAHPQFIFPVESSSGDALDIYFRLKTDGSVTWPIEVTSQSHYSELRNTTLVVRGAYFGIMLVMVLYNLLIFSIIRQRAYAYYVVFVSSFLFFQMVYEGVAFQYFWPTSSWLNAYMLPLSYSLNQIAMIAFIRVFMELSGKHERLDTYFKVLMFTALAMVVGVAVIPYKVLVPTVVLLSLIVTISGFSTGAYLWRRGNKFAHYFTVAWALLLVGLVLGNLRALGVIPSNFLTVHAYQFGAVLEVMLLSLALARRIDIAQKDKATAEKAMIRAQRESILNLKRYQDLYDNAVAGMFQSNLQDRFIRVNGALAKMLGYASPQEMVSQVATITGDLAADKSDMDALFRRLLNEKSVMDRELKLRCKDGQYIWVSMTVRTVLDTLGNVDHLEGSVVDITERKFAESYRQEEERRRMAALENVVVGVAHEISTPMGINLTSLSLIEDRRTELKNVFESGRMTKQSFEGFMEILDDGIELMSRNLNRIDTLVHNFRQVSVHHLGYYQREFDVSELISNFEFNDSVDLSDVTLNLKLPDATDSCSYPDAFILILEKLLENSIQHGFSSNDADKTVEVELISQPSKLTLIYKDNGKGLSDVEKDKIFMPFYTTQRGVMGRTGLGMYIVFNVATQLLQGRINVLDHDGFALSIEVPRYLQVDEIEDVQRISRTR